jgi:hypothetical protein
MSVIQAQNIKKDEIYYYFFLSFFDWVCKNMFLNIFWQATRQQSLHVPSRRNSGATQESPVREFDQESLALRLLHPLSDEVQINLIAVISWTRERKKFFFFFILNRSWSIPDGLTNTLIWYGIINPSAAAPASSAVNLFTPWRLTTSATDSGRLWCNFYSQKLEWGSFTVSRANVFHFMAGLSKIGFEPESVKRGSYKPALRRLTLAFSIPTYPHNLFHSLIQVNSTYQCMSTTFHTKFNHFLWWV